jgi:hypothetical protein
MRLTNRDPRFHRNPKPEVAEAFAPEAEASPARHSTILENVPIAAGDRAR